MNLRKALIVMFFLTFQVLAGGQSLTVMTYNIRFDNPADGKNAWPHRKNWMCNQIKDVDPVVFGIQEGLLRQLRFMDSVFPGYGRIGVGRDDGKTQGEYCAIYYNKSVLKLKKSGNFWLSVTPEKPSKGWDAALPRICTYGLFMEKTSGRYFWVFNTHFDHVGVVARENSATLILEKISKMNTRNYPVVLMGDFNSTPEEGAAKVLLAAMTDSKVADKSMTMGPDGTFNGFDPAKPLVERIDFIFTGFGAQPESYFVRRESKDGVFPSDHYPVIARIKLTQ